MVERRSLTQGLKATPEVDANVIEDFVYAGRHGNSARPAATPQAVAPQSSVPGRVPISTRIRDDYAKALKRASLERQLNGTKPDTLQGILEEAIGPWLKANGYLE